MLKSSASYTTIILISTALGLLSVSCSRSTSTTTARGNAQPITTATTPGTVPASPAAVKPPTSPVPEAVEADSSQPNYYELALGKAFSAWSNSQSAHSAVNWRLVATQWQDAIILLEAVPANSPNKAIAQTKTAEYQRQLTYAQQQATRTTRKNSDNVVAILPETPISPRSVPHTAVLPSQIVFRAPIKRLIGGTPVVEVTFNGIQPVEMILDTGASGTVITQQTAAALGVVPVTKAEANTASARAVEFPVGYVNSISIGGAVVKNLPVAIAPSTELEIGLLGHDFFGDYDLTIKRNVVEFRPR